MEKIQNPKGKKINIHKKKEYHTNKLASSRPGGKSAQGEGENETETIDVRIKNNIRKYYGIHIRYI